MGFTYAVPTTVGGTVLIIEQIESQNYAAGTTGWAIMAAGDAEFNNATVRGQLLVGTDPGQHILVGLDSLSRPVIELSTGSAVEGDPGYVRTSPASSDPALQISSPLNSSAPVGSIRPRIDLTAWTGSASSLNLWADQLFTNNPITLDTTWVGLTGNMSNGWVDLAGSRVGYFKDATGRVQLRGVVVSGTAATIYTLPAGYRPSQSMEWTMRGVGGTVLCAVQVTTAGVVSVTANLATAQASGIKLDAISYPTL